MNIDLLIYRISSGKLLFKYNGQQLVLNPASIDVRYRAEIYYEEIIDDLLYENWLRKDDLPLILRRMDMWKDNDEKLLKQIENSIENSKISLYQNRSISKKVDSIRKNLENQKKSIGQLLEKKYYLDHLTLEEYAKNKKAEFIISETLVDKNNNRFIKNFQKTSSFLINDIVSTIHNYYISIDSYKKIALSEQWKKIWNCGKENPFNKSACEYTEEQQSLVNISLMYDRIYENPECPAESVIEDSDMLDGWMLDQKRKIEEQKRKDAGQSISDKHKGAKEVFIIADQDEVEDVMQMNDFESRSIIKSRSKVLENSEDWINVGNLPDVQRELQQQRSRMKP